LDHVRNGVNDKICEKLQLSGREFLLPKMTKSGIVIGSGMTGFLPKAMAPEAFLEYLAEKMQIDFCKYTPVSRLISKVAVCGGAGSFLLEEAKKSGADAFITSDFKYHQFFDAENQIMIADIGHYESERFTCELLADFLRSSFHGINLRITGVNTNPVQYFKKQ
jgi:putative NIF3 family GTP cyclohydrolase 1 type 2